MRLPILERIHRVEGVADKLTLVLIIGLGLAMLIGLLTASGHVTW